jgi:hypothetical protein
MNFQAHLAAMVMDGRKTVTRRLVSDNPRSPWSRERCSLKVGETYAVCPGRGKHAIGRVRIVSTTLEPLGVLTDDEARREGFESEEHFCAVFSQINGGLTRRGTRGAAARRSRRRATTATCSATSAATAATPRSSSAPHPRRSTRR